MRERDATWLYMTAGCSVLACAHLRNLWLLMFGLVPLGLQYAENAIAHFKVQALKVYEAAMCAVCGLLLILVFSFELFATCEEDRRSLVGCEEYMASNISSEDAKIYTDFNTGGYIEWLGYRVYIDARPELFQERVNGVADVADEYSDVVNGTADYEAFLEKYSFTHLLVEKSCRLAIYLGEQPNYEIVYEDERYALYEKNVH